MTIFILPLEGSLGLVESFEGIEKKQQTLYLRGLRRFHYRPSLDVAKDVRISFLRKAIHAWYQAQGVIRISYRYVHVRVYKSVQINIKSFSQTSK